MKISTNDLCVARVLHEEEQFITLEVAKDNQASFTLQKDEDGNTVGGDKFLTLLFLHKEGNGMAIWKPWEGASA